MRQKTKFCLSLLIAASFLVPTTASAADPVGVLAVASGAASVIRGTVATTVSQGDQIDVYAEDTIQTKNGSQGEVTLGTQGQEDRFTLSEDTTFVIDEYIEDDVQPTRGFFSLLGGKVRSFVNNTRGKKDISLRTSSATIGVKGTDFVTEVPNDEVTQVTTFEGVVSLQSRLEDGLLAVDVSGGFTSVVLKGSAPSSPFALSRESLIESSRESSLQASLQTTPSVSTSRLITEQSLQDFRKAQFDAVIERAALTSGSLIKVQIIFPDQE